MVVVKASSSPDWLWFCLGDGVPVCVHASRCLIQQSTEGLLARGGSSSRQAGITATMHTACVHLLLLRRCCTSLGWVCTAAQPRTAALSVVACGSVRLLKLSSMPLVAAAVLQVRIHSATACQFYLRVRSRPIIEHSSSLSFAPYATESLLCKQEPGAAAAAGGSSTPDDKQQQQGVCPPDWDPAQSLQAAQLSEESGLWQQVDDFGWVKASASPHWRVLPEPDRQGVPERLPLPV